MKRFIALTLFSLGFGIATTGCAHHQLTKSRAADAALGIAVISAVVAAAMFVPCDHCNVGAPFPERPGN